VRGHNILGWKTGGVLGENPGVYKLFPGKGVLELFGEGLYTPRGKKPGVGGDHKKTF